MAYTVAIENFAVDSLECLSNLSGPETIIAALHRAAKLGSNEIVKLLLEHKDHVDHYEIFTQAIEKGNYTICKYLIDAGFNIHATDVNRNTPLHYAAESSLGNIFHLLVRHGANPNALNTDSETPICMMVNFLNCTDKEENDIMIDAIEECMDSHECDFNCSERLTQYINTC